MSTRVDSIDVQEYHEYARAFRRAAFDADELARFLNEMRGANDESKWTVDGDKKDANEKAGRKRVVINKLGQIEDSWLFTDKIVIDEDSILWVAKASGRTVTEQDETPQAWPELSQCKTWVKEFYELDESFFEEPANRYRDVYLTRTDGIAIACQMERMLHPDLWTAMSESVEAAYDERQLSVVLHPYGIQTKVNCSPTPETMATLSQGQIKAAIARDDIEIGVRRFEDYGDRRITFASQMPFHSHVKALRAIIEVAASIAHPET